LPSANFKSKYNCVSRLQLVTQRPQVVPVYNGQQQQQQHWMAQQQQQQLQMPRPRIIAPPRPPQPQVPVHFSQPMRMRPPVPQPVVPVQPQMASEIAYNVEHVFNENGREVRKMPIKMGEETLWVDCVDQVKIESNIFSCMLVFDNSALDFQVGKPQLHNTSGSN
jgi:hypothetical protein